MIVNGEVLGTMNAWDYYDYKKKLQPKVQEAYDELASEYDIIVIEGAGSQNTSDISESVFPP